MVPLYFGDAGTADGSFHLPAGGLWPLQVPFRPGPDARRRHGIGVSLLGLIIFSGFNFTSLKMLLVVVFLWFASPVSSHLIAKLEVVTDEDLEQHCEVKR